MPVEAPVQTDLRTIVLPEHLPQPEVTTFNLNSGNSLFMANGLQPISTESLLEGDKKRDIDVLARVVMPKNDTALELLVAKDSENPESQIEIHRIRRQDDELISEAVRFANPDGSFSITGSNGEKLAYSPADKRHRGWASLQVYNLGRIAKVSVSEAVHPLKRTEYNLKDYEKRKKRIMRLGALVMSVAVMKGITTPGGMYDRVMDAHRDAGTYVVDKFGSLPKAIAEIPAGGEDRDGVHISQAELAKGIKEEKGPYYQAVARVARTIGELDAHNYKAVESGVRSFEETVNTHMWSQEEIAQSQKELADSKSSREALGDISKFMKKFGGQAFTSPDLLPEQVDSNSFHDSLKLAGKQIMEVLSELPEPVLRSSIGSGRGVELTKDGPGIEFAFGSKERKSEFMGREAAHYEASSLYGQSGRLVLFTTGEFSAGITDIATMNLKHVIRHEISHGLFDGSLLENDKAHYGSIITQAENAGSRLIDRPEFTSNYATSSADEETAEAGAQDLAGNITDPDHVGSFESRANYAKLADLIELEKGMPGITAYLFYMAHPELFSQS